MLVKPVPAMSSAAWSNMLDRPERTAAAIGQFLRE